MFNMVETTNLLEQNDDPFNKTDRDSLAGLSLNTK
jgi:hypothetical protein